ncbi:DUF2345 domain-containing protein, partial [Burkholderia vietnamiensis]|uniref:DUF2345 domain-containing protein n=1 Tax=Burkholderia vietnamiensis TaxID=60552 RepID=UPI000A51A89E
EVDFADWPAGGESVPLRLAKPFAGKWQTGFHFPALDNDEAVIAFRDADPDKPEIIGFHHHSQARDLVTSDRRWLSRNVIRTQSNNKLRMEDWAGQEGIKLSTEHSGTSHLDLGYLVDEKLERRGEGFELRTSGHGVERAGKGLHLTACDRPGASGKQLDMQETIAQLEQALALAKSLGDAARTAKAMPADTDAQQQMKDELDGLKKPGLLMSTPASAGIIAGQGVQIAAEDNISAVAGKSADFSVMKRFTATAGERISLFAQKLGIKIFAGKGPVELQAQSGAMSLAADKDVSIVSVTGQVDLIAAKEIILECGGAFIQLKDGNITLGGPGDLLFKVITIQKQGAASMNTPLNLTHPALATLPTTPLILNAIASPASKAVVPAGMPYKLFADGILVKQGVFDETGLLQIDHHVTTQQYKLELANGVTHTFPVSEDYRGESANAALANSGYHFHENSRNPDITPPGDRAAHRQRYSDLIDIAPDSQTGA